MGILQEELLHQTKRYDTLVFCKKSYWIKLTDGRESNANYVVACCSNLMLNKPLVHGGYA